VNLLHTRWPMFAALVAGCAAVALLWYFVLSDPSGEAVPATGGRYVEGVTRAPERINPLYAASNPVDGDLAALVFSGLVRLGPDGMPRPDLAERWEITGNGTRYVFYLRRGVGWQDNPNNRVDADDVLFTFDAISDPGFKGDPALARIMDGVVVTARDPYTVEFRLEQAYAPFLAYLTVGILPEHLLAELDSNELYNAEFNARPIGTGPYSLTGRDANSVRLAANSTYHFGPPRISEIEFRVFATPGEMSEALRLDDIDGALFPPDHPVEDLEALLTDDAVQANELAATSTFVLYLDTRSRLFSDGDVRRALQQSLNVQALLDALEGLRAVGSETGIPASSWAYSPAEVPPFDPGAAARALENAGWSRAADGVRRNGEMRLAFTIITSDNPLRVRIAEEVARQWGAIAASVSVEAVPADALIDNYVTPREFEAALVEIDYGPDPDPYPFWHSSQITAPGLNLSGFSSARLDDVLETARGETDAALRTEQYSLFAGYFIADQPALPLFSPVYVYAQNTRVQGVEPALLFTPASRFDNVHEWFVRTRVRS
jgi:peptide/nickel transport system substrate-binding protein